MSQQQQQNKDVCLQLSERCVKKIIEEEDIKALQQQTYFFQVLNVKIFDTDANLQEGKEQKKQVKMRCTLSDGESTVLAMMNKQVYDKMTDESIPQFSVIQLFTFLKQSIQDKTILVLSKPPKVIYKDVGAKIGSPKDYNANKKEGFTDQFDSSTIKIPRNVLAKHGLNEDGTEREEGQEDVEMAGSQDDKTGEQIQKMFNPTNEDAYTPIKALSTFNYDWRIKARVTKKSEVRRWKNHRTEGYLINIDLMDKHGTQIQATFFKDACDKFEPMLQEGKVYSFSNGTVKIANQRFTSIKNDFCLVFDRQAEIVEVPEDASIQANAFSFHTMKDIKEMDKPRAIDVIAVVCKVEEVISCMLRSGVAKDKRMVHITDESNLSIMACFWADQAHQFDAHREGTVIAIKNVRVVEFLGRSLNQHEDTYLEIEPKIPRTAELRKWWDGLSNLDALRPIVDSGSGDGGFEKKETVRLVAEMNTALAAIDRNPGQYSSNQLKDTFFLVNGYISFIKNDEKSYYLSCPEDGCRKKVVMSTPAAQDGGAGAPQYHCDYCHKTYDHCKPTYMILAKVADMSDNVFINYYRDQGNQLMSIGPEEMHRLKENDDISAINDAFYEAHFKYYTTLVKAQIRSYGDEVKMNLYAFRVMDHSWRHENEQLLKRLDVYKTLPDKVPA